MPSKRKPPFFDKRRRFPKLRLSCPSRFAPPTRVAGRRTMREQPLKTASLEFVVATALAAIVALAMSMGVITHTAWADRDTYTNAKIMIADMKKQDKVLDLGTKKEALSIWTIKAQVKNARSSNPKVLQVKVAKSKDSKGYWNIVLKAKKPGKATVSYSIKGKSYKFDCTVVKYVNPFTKLTIGGKDYKKKLNKTNRVNIGKIPAKAIVFKLAPGWKVKSAEAIQSFYTDDGCYDEYYKLKSGTKLREGMDFILFNLYNTETKAERQIELRS